MFSKEKEETVGSECMSMIAGADIWKLNRDSFWAHAEREEQERREEERRRAAEEKRRRERERIQQERWNAEERERRMNEETVQKQRNLQDQIEAGNCKQEWLRWEQRQREQETRHGPAHTDSIQRVAEAAALLSQRSANPREFFKQLTTSFSSSSSSPTSGSPHKARPKFRPHQPSLTDSCFGRIEPSTPAMVSPRISSKSSDLICPQQVSLEHNAPLSMPPQVSSLTPFPLPWTPLVPSQTLSLPQVRHSSLNPSRPLSALPQIPCKLRELEAEFTEGQGESVGIEVDIEERKMEEIKATPSAGDKREEEDKVQEEGIEERGGMGRMKAMIYEDEGMEGIEEIEGKVIEKDKMARKTDKEEAEERIGEEDTLDGKEGTDTITSPIELDTSLEGPCYSPETPPINPATEEQHYFTQNFSDLHPTFAVFGPALEESLSGLGLSASTMESTSTSNNPMSQCTANQSVQPIPVPIVALEEKQPGLNINLEMESFDEEGQEVLVEEEEEEPSIKITDEEGLDPEFHPLNGLSRSKNSHRHISVTSEPPSCHLSVPCKIYLLELWPKSSILVSSDHNTFSNVLM
uniref:Ensconsin-like n=1 Tax=Esox lucius TaxID=8010 RepID=A0A3P8ZSE2_ESOLU